MKRHPARQVSVLRVVAALALAAMRIVADPAPELVDAVLHVYA